MRAIQRVKKLLKNINPLIRNYVICLIVSRGRKTCSNMAHLTRIPENYLYKFFEQAAPVVKEIEEILVQLTEQAVVKTGKKALVMDPTHILKPYAKYMQMLCYDRAGTTKRPEHCLAPIYAMLVHKFLTIPLALVFWVQEKFAGRGKYKSKARLTYELILRARWCRISYDFIALDGAYAIREVFYLLAYLGEKFIMRIAKSRKIKTSDGIEMQLQHHPALKLHRNEREKMVQAKYQDRLYFFTAQKRLGKNGFYEVVYLISNMELPAKEQVEAYNMRWPMESCIRTTKQKFGAMQCQALEIEKQHAHLMGGFLAYAILEIANIAKESQSVDELVNEIRDYYSDDLISLIEKPTPFVNAKYGFQPQNPFKNRPVIRQNNSIQPSV